MTTISHTPRIPLAEWRRRAVLEHIRSLNTLAAAVTVPMRILELHRSGSASMNDFATAIMSDVSLASKVLGLANSASFAPLKPITRVSHAASMIGMKNLLSLAFGVSLSGIFNKLGIPPSESRALWRAALLKAVAAREVISASAPELAEEAFLAGLLQDIGLPVIHAADPSAWPEFSCIVDVEQPQREQAMFGFDHTTIGQLVADRVGLPKYYRAVIAAHHAPADQSDPVLAAAHAAAALPHRLVHFVPGVIVKAGTFSEATPTNPTLAARVCAAYSETLKALGDSEVNTATFNQFIVGLSEQVASCLEGAIGESSSTISTLKARETELFTRVKALEQQLIDSDVDSLTKTLNRRAFFLRSQHFFRLAHEYQTACSMGFVDMDNLKLINDSYSHAAGDKAIQLLASRLEGISRDKGLIARMGGDEFALLLIAKTPEENQAMAQQLAGSIAGLTLEHEGQTIALTASLGMVWLGVPHLHPTIENMLHSADQLMYRAKRRGKGQYLADQMSNIEPAATAA